MPSPTPPPLDRLSSLLERFKVRAQLFHHGPLCGISRFPAEPGRGFLHVMQRGELELRHGKNPDGLPRRLHIAEPTLLFYPRPLAHEFRNPPEEGSDFVCAELAFEGGERHPLVRALPPLIVLPLSQVQGLSLSLPLLFSETEQLRCGQRLLADRLFEVVLIQLLRWVIDHPQAVGVDSGLFMGLSDPRLARLLVALHQAPQDDWTLARMAAVAGMSRSAFADAFKAATGTTPSAYLTDWRLTIAASWLRAGQAQKLVAAELGFSTASSLSRAFKQRFGASPRGWLDGQAPTG